MTEHRITLNEFKMWLQGVEEMQGEDWIPDARQWKRIREKFNEIQDAPAAAPPPPQVITHRQMPFHDGQMHPNNFSPPGSGLNIPPPKPNSLMSGKTPDIDTTRGHYEPAFV